jgi:hypothetical protein
MLYLWLACSGTEPLPEAGRVDAVDVQGAGEPGRPRRRMNIDQVASSLERATGHAWTETSSGETVRLFDQLSGSLGKPDYLASTAEDLSPGLLFQKFLDDAAKSSCTAMVEAEEPAFFVHGGVDDEGAVEANMELALLRFHGRRASAEELQLWTGLWVQLEGISGEPERAWLGVCVALVTHPDFSTF